MNPRTDSQLLLDFAERRSDAAFAELVRRHLNLVHAAALRITRDPDLAKDVSQAVFIALASQAGKLAGHAVLAGWLHRSTRNIAAQSIRSETRRRAREQAAAIMHDPSEDDSNWQHIAPQLDAALSDLAAADRDAILLRYFENKSAREMADLLGIAPEAAQKRVTRAVERLREKLERRGIPTAAGSLAAAIAAYAAPAAPTGLASMISVSALPATGSALLASSSLLAMTTLQKSILATAALLLLGVGFHHLTSPALSTAPDSAAATPLPGKSTDRSDVPSTGNPSKQRPAADPKTEERRRALADLKQRWLAIGDDNARWEERRALAKESVELLSCSPEAYELSIFLVENELDNQLLDGPMTQLVAFPQGRVALQSLAEIVESNPPDKWQHAILETWIFAAGRFCPESEFQDFHASLKNSAYAQEALLGRNFAVFKSDPEAAVRTALRVLESNVDSLSKNAHLQRLLERGSKTLDYRRLEQILPPDSGSPDVQHWTPTDWGRHSLLINWGGADPEAAARHVMAHPERMPPHLLEYIVVGAGRFGASASPLHWVPELPPGPYYDAAAKGVATNFQEQAPEQAREIVLKMSDPKLREEALKQLESQLESQRESDGR